MRCTPPTRSSACSSWSFPSSRETACDVAGQSSHFDQQAILARCWGYGVSVTSMLPSQGGRRSLDLESFIEAYPTCE
jgi:hypothetical protein